MGVHSPSASDLDSPTYGLCDLGKVTSFSEMQFPQKIIMSTQHPKEGKLSICINSGNPDMLQSIGSQRVGPDLATEQQIIKDR